MAFKKEKLVSLGFIDSQNIIRSILLRFAEDEKFFHAFPFLISQISSKNLTDFALKRLSSFNILLFWQIF